MKSFNLQPGRVLARNYEVISKLGAGWEGEVYRIRERSSGIERAAKLFFPERNLKNKTADAYAKKLHALRECPIVIQYHVQDTIRIQGTLVRVLISEYVEGTLLSDYLSSQRGKKLHVFQAIHLLHALAAGIEAIHYLGEYHGDLHTENIMVRRLGLSYELKLLDFFHWGGARRESRKDDICDVVRIFYDALGGQRRYASHPPEVKEICCGLKRSLILAKFPTASDLRFHVETQAWT